MSSERRWGGLAEGSQSDWQVVRATLLHATCNNQALSEFAVVL